MQWVRLKAAVDCPLRRGAWYRVALLTELEAVVNIEGKSVSLPRPFVEVRTTPPREWTVLRNPTISRGTPEIFRRGYIVCPGCRNRVVLPPTQLQKQWCPRCTQTFTIAWDENYLEQA